MTAEAVLALLGDMYGQITQLNARVAELLAENNALKSELLTSSSKHAAPAAEPADPDE